MSRDTAAGPVGPTDGVMRRNRFLLLGLLALNRPAAVAAHPGVGIVMDRHGAVYYTDLANVWRIAPDGRKAIVVPGVHTHELWLDPDGTLYGEHLWYNGERLNTWGHRVWRRAPDGAITDVIPATPGFLTGSSFVRDAAGTMYLVDRGDSTVFRKRLPRGAVTSWAVCHDCRRVGWPHVTPGGTLYFMDGSDLRRVTPDGRIGTVVPGLTRIRLLRPPMVDGQMAMGLWTDRSGSVYVAVYDAREVRKVAPDGRVSLAARSDNGWGPTGGLVAPDGALWLLENSNANTVRVRRIGPDGRVTVY